MVRRSQGIHIDLPIPICTPVPASPPSSPEAPRTRYLSDPFRTPQQKAKARRDAYRDQGLCIYGDKQPAEPGHSTCADCRSKFQKGGKYGADKPGRSWARKARGLPDRRKVEYRDKVRGGLPTRRHRGPRLK